MSKAKAGRKVKAAAAWAPLNDDNTIDADDADTSKGMAEFKAGFRRVIPVLVIPDIAPIPTRKRIRKAKR